MDESLTRRGQPCWYKCKGVGHIAINDAVTTEALVFKILKRHFAHDECYLQLVGPARRQCSSAGAAAHCPGLLGRTPQAHGCAAHLGLAAELLKA